MRFFQGRDTKVLVYRKVTSLVVIVVLVGREVGKDWITCTSKLYLDARINLKFS